MPAGARIERPPFLSKKEVRDMAVTSKHDSCKLMLSVVTGQTDAGTDKHATRSIANINPAITADDAYAIAVSIGQLQTNAVDAIKRQDTVDYTEE